jgi:hypothetical protein
MKQIKWTRPVLAALVLASGLATDAAQLTPRPHGQKPMHPLWARLGAVNQPEPGGVVRLVASVTAWVPGEEIRWSLDVPPPLTHLSGPDRWSGLLARGETISFAVEIAVPDGGSYEVHSRAGLAERTGVTSGATLPIDLGGFEGPRGTERLVIGNGTTYLQYQGEVTAGEEEGR